LHIVFYYHVRLPVKEYGGIERFVVWLIKGLSERGHKVTLIGPEGNSVAGCEKRGGPFAGVRVPTPELLGRYIPEGADIIHFNGDYAFGDYGLPSLTTVRGCVKGFAGLKDVSFISDAQRKYWGYPDAPFIHNGLDPSEYIFRREKDDYFLFLSRVDWEVKGVGVAIEAAERAGARLLIAGNVHRKTFVNSFFRGFLKKKLSDRIQYVGPVGGELKAMLLAKAKALIFPTQWCEPFGNVTIEALVSGTPVITTHNGAMPEIVEHGRTGFLCDGAAEMAEAIRGIGAIDQAECRRAVEERFTYQSMAAAYESLYASVAGRR